VSKAIKQSASESFRAEDLCPFFERQIAGDHQAVVFIGLADDLEEQLCAGLGEWNIAQLIQNEQMKALQLFVQTLKASFFPAFQQLGYQCGCAVEADFAALGAC
jgi:hypothetical protein